VTDDGSWAGEDGGGSKSAETTITIEVVQRCDVNNDGIVDISDINAIMAARNTPATGPDDSRDVDGNGIIDANDARQCTLECTNSRCVQ
jgi:hypothetical protein